MLEKEAIEQKSTHKLALAGPQAGTIHFYVGFSDPILNQAVESDSLSEIIFQVRKKLQVLLPFTFMTCSEIEFINEKQKETYHYWDPEIMPSIGDYDLDMISNALSNELAVIIKELVISDHNSRICFIEDLLTQMQQKAHEFHLKTKLAEDFNGTCRDYDLNIAQAKALQLDKNRAIEVLCRVNRYKYFRLQFFGDCNLDYGLISQVVDSLAECLLPLRIVFLGRSFMEENRSVVNRKVAKAFHNMLNLLFNVAKARDQETGKHQGRIKLKGELFLEYLADQNYRQVDISEKDRLVIEKLGANKIGDLLMLHDIGKVGVQDRILQKPGNLNDEEYRLMKEHVSIGVDMVLETLRLITDPDDEITLFYKTLVDIIWSHHEKFDGSGYPLMLKGNEISFLGRLMTLIDAQDAMRHRRVYKPPLPKIKIMEIIQKDSGLHFDPDLVDIYINQLTEKFEAIDQEYAD